MINLTKPIYSFQKHQCYKRHRKQLSTINNTKTIPSINDTSYNLKKLRYQSISFHNKQKQDSINQQNQKILKRILNITNRKKSELHPPYIPVKINQYNNPARKKKQRFITQMNHQLAERLINLPSTINIKTMTKEMEEYEKLKKSLINNRRILHSSLHLSRIKNHSFKKQHSEYKSNLRQTDKDEF